MRIFKQMAKQGHDKLLGHPLSQTFLAMKWKIIRHHFTYLFAVYVLLAVFHTIHCYMFTHLKEKNWAQCGKQKEACKILETDPQNIYKGANTCKLVIQFKDQLQVAFYKHVLQGRKSLCGYPTSSHGFFWHWWASETFFCSFSSSRAWQERVKTGWTC